MRIEFDPVKDAANIRKHQGLSLSDAARAQWDENSGNERSRVYPGGDEAMIFPDNRFAYGEARLSALVPVGNRLCHVSFTETGEESIRVISMRYAERNEVADYVRNYR